MFKRDLFKLREKIYEMSNKSSSELQKEVIDKILNKKLERSYNNYAEMITSKINYILSRNNYKAIKAMNKMVEEDKEVASDE